MDPGKNGSDHYCAGVGVGVRVEVADVFTPTVAVCVVVREGDLLPTTVRVGDDPAGVGVRVRTGVAEGTRIVGGRNAAVAVDVAVGNRITTSASVGVGVSATLVDVAVGVGNDTVADGGSGVRVTIESGVLVGRAREPATRLANPKQ